MLKQAKSNSNIEGLEDDQEFSDLDALDESKSMYMVRLNAQLLLAAKRMYTQ